MAKDDPKAPPRLALPAANFKLKESVALQYHAIIPEGHTRDMMESPAYWCHHAKRLSPNAEITFVANDYSFYGKAIVMMATENTATVWIVEWADRKVDDGKIVDQDLYKVDHVAKGWRVIDKRTGRIEREGISSREEAARAVIDLLKKAA